VSRARRVARIALPAFAVVLFAASSGCSSDGGSDGPGTTTGDPDGGGGRDGGGGANGGRDAGGGEGGTNEEAGTPDEFGCTTYVDRTRLQDARVINWVRSVGTDPARCLKITQAQTVTWKGDFTAHPLAPAGASAGGAPPNPIASPTSPAADERAAEFNRLGTFGYMCTSHPDMRGAIQVVP
jgi:plastocyanin